MVTDIGYIIRVRLPPFSKFKPGLTESLKYYRCHRNIEVLTMPSTSITPRSSHQLQPLHPTSPRSSVYFSDPAKSWSCAPPKYRMLGIPLNQAHPLTAVVQAFAPVASQSSGAQFVPNLGGYGKI